MAGYDFSHKHPFRLMQGRLGVYDKQPYDAASSSLEGVKDQHTRLQHQGGNTQQERMIKDRRRSLDRAVWFSYQAAEIKKVDRADRKPVRALLNPNKLTQDYDDKILSVGFEHDIKCGDIFEWVGTNTHWLVYLQDLTELAYFRGDVRKCSFEIAWQDEEGEHRTYAAIKGPDQTKLSTGIKHGISIDSPNYSLSLLLPQNEETLNYFKRYTKFYLQGQEICWRVEALDWLSTPGILEVHAMEYYANEHEDDIDNGIVGGLIVTPESPNTKEEENTIIGDTFIKPKKTYQFRFNGSLATQWRVDDKTPVTLTIDPTDARKILVKWNNSYSGQFELYYGDYHKTIVVESLF